MSPPRLLALGMMGASLLCCAGAPPHSSVREAEIGVEVARAFAAEQWGCGGDVEVVAGRWRQRDECSGERLFELHSDGCQRSGLVACVVATGECRFEQCFPSPPCAELRSEDEQVDWVPAGQCAVRG